MHGDRGIDAPKIVAERANSPRHLFLRDIVRKAAHIDIHLPRAFRSAPVDRERRQGSFVRRELLRHAPEQKCQADKGDLFEFAHADVLLN